MGNCLGKSRDSAEFRSPYPKPSDECVSTPPTIPIRSVIDENEQREEEEHQRRMKKIRENGALRRQEIMNQNNMDLQARRKRQMQQKEANSQFEAEIKRQRSENERRNQESNREFEAMYNMNSMLPIPRNLKFVNEMNEIERSMENNRRRHEYTMSEQRLESERNRQDHLRKMEDIQENYERAKEKMNREAEEYNSLMRQQYAELMRIMQRYVWTSIIERNWTNRLNSLRGANKASQRLESCCLLRNPDPRKLQEWIYSLEILQDQMQREIENLRELFIQTDKSFLLTIKRSVENVEGCCQKLIIALKSRGNTENLKHLSGQLNNACRLIPTLLELKQQYYSDMKINSSL